MNNNQESEWREKLKKALETSKEGEHAWFVFKDDNFDSCAKCGIIRRKDDKNIPCKGKTKITLR